MDLGFPRRAWSAQIEPEQLCSALEEPVQLPSTLPAEVAKRVLLEESRNGAVMMPPELA